MLSRSPALMLLLLSLSPSLAGASTLCVNTAGSDGCFASVQQAIDAAGKGEVVDVAPGTYVEHVVVPTKSSLSIVGGGADTTIVDGSGAGTVIDLPGPGTRVAIAGLKIQNGARGIAAGERVRLTLRECAITGNTAGGGIDGDSGSTIDITGCDVSGNTNAERGGGIQMHEYFPSRLTVRLSTIRGNSTTGHGGGIFTVSRLTLIDSTVSGNSGANGGGLYAWNSKISGSTISGNTASGDGGGTSAIEFSNTAKTHLRISNSTISGNHADRNAGGVQIVHDTQLDHVTIANNSAGLVGGGISYGSFQSNPGSATLRATLSADNTATELPNCAGFIRGLSNNLIEGAADQCAVTNIGGSVLLSDDPLLGPLQDIGGPTETQALAPGSLALGVVTTRAECRQPDQRGVARAVPCDLGAFEAP